MISMYGVSGTTDDVVSSGPEMKVDITNKIIQPRYSALCIPNQTYVLLLNTKYVILESKWGLVLFWTAVTFQKNFKISSFVFHRGKSYM